MSPILVRPVREQLEHDRIIRLLQNKFRRKFDVGANVGAEQVAPAGVGSTAIFPDVVLTSQERGKRLQVVVEVETGESVNHLEALAEWALSPGFARPFTYVPSGMVDVARRLCEDKNIRVNEIWSFHNVGDEVRFTLVHRSREAAAPAPRVRPAVTASSASRKPRAAAAKRPTRPKPAARRRPVRKATRPQKRK